MFIAPKCSFNLNLISVVNLLTVESPADVRCDPEFFAVPEAIHLAVEVLRELWSVDHQ